MKLHFKLNNLDFTCDCTVEEFNSFLLLRNPVESKIENIDWVTRYDKPEEAPIIQEQQPTLDTPVSSDVFGHNDYTLCPALKVNWKEDKLALHIITKEGSVYSRIKKGLVLTLIDRSTISITPSRGTGYRPSKHQLTISIAGGTVIDEKSPFFEYFFTRMEGDVLRVHAFKSAGVWRLS